MKADRDELMVQLEDLYRSRLTRFLQVAYAIAGDHDVARDVVQEAFAKAVRERERFRADGPLEAWVWTIVVNGARKERRRGTTVELPASAGEAPADNGFDGGADVRAAIAGLPERQRHILFLRYYADLDYGAIAQVLDLRSGTVGAALSQAHAVLRERLKEERL